MKPQQQAEDLAAQVEDSEGEVYFIQDWMDVKAALEALNEAEQETCTAFGCDDAL
jgi:hypothetical protein